VAQPVAHDVLGNGRKAGDEACVGADIGVGQHQAVVQRYDHLAADDTRRTQRVGDRIAAVDHQPDAAVEVCERIEVGLGVARNQRAHPAVGARSMGGDEQLAVPIGGVERKE
jgi:hypothetical protein